MCCLTADGWSENFPHPVTRPPSLLPSFSPPPFRVFTCGRYRLYCQTHSLHHVLERNCLDLDESNVIADQTFAVLTLNKTLTGYIGPCIFILLSLLSAAPPLSPIQCSWVSWCCRVDLRSAEFWSCLISQRVLL